MFPQHALALLLWRLRREFGLYLLGVDSSAPIVPTAPTLLLAAAASYVHLRSFPTETALMTVLTVRVQAQARGHDLRGRPLCSRHRRLSDHGRAGEVGPWGALAPYTDQLAVPASFDAISQSTLGSASSAALGLAPSRLGLDAAIKPTYVHSCEIDVSKLPDFDGLAIFAKVVQTRSFVAAAGELRLSKATVSKAISRIEKKFGTRLFNRSARRLGVTEAGRQLYERAAHILAEGEAAEDAAIAQSAVPRGRVRLTAPISFGVLHIAPILPEFLAQYPDVSIDLHLTDNHVDLVGEGYDAAIRIASLPDSSLMTRILAPVSRHLAAAPSYLSKYGRPSHPLRLSEHRCIAYISTSGETWHFSNAAGETATVRPLGPLRVNNGDAMLPTLTAGVGIGILPDFILREALGDGRLEIVLPEWKPSGGSVHWLTPPGGRSPKRVEVLGDFFQHKLSSKRPPTKRATQQKPAA